ncbi:MAG: hypothetical protein BM564_01755 [Bacteroidetes bacterium MedPE-SWsnd-G2]|nr:MAG: hypothetical protein BM564_01755 [Bacteroidetes bacterium MedPE-SWsnd-G2]
MKTTTFLTFVNEQCGKTEEAMAFYTSIFPNSEIKTIIKYQEGEAAGTPDLVKYGEFTINGVPYRISENSYNHAWSITPGVSLFLDCHSEDEIDNFFEQLSQDGQIMIPLDNYGSDNYGFGKKFGWCADKFGVSWQLNLME